MLRLYDAQIANAGIRISQHDVEKWLIATHKCSLPLRLTTKSRMKAAPARHERDGHQIEARVENFSIADVITKANYRLLYRSTPGAAALKALQ
jgi:hypothetical protein